MGNCYGIINDVEKYLKVEKCTLFDSSYTVISSKVQLCVCIHMGVLLLYKCEINIWTLSIIIATGYSLQETDTFLS